MPFVWACPVHVLPYGVCDCFVMGQPLISRVLVGVDIRFLGNVGANESLKGWAVRTRDHGGGD